MSDAQKLFEERMQIRSDTIAHKIPKRVMMSTGVTLEAAAGLADVPLIEVHYKPELREKAFRATCETFYSDTNPCGDLRFPAPYQLLKAKNWILGSNGAVQHPEIETMYVEDYDEFIEDPIKLIYERFLPRVCSIMDTEDQVKAAIDLAKAYDSFKEARAVSGGLAGKLGAEYGFIPGMITNQMIEAPFDFLADQLRGFKAISMDCRRVPDKVEKACERLVDVMVDLATPNTPDGTIPPGLITFIPLHLAPYLNQKAFDRLYWPTFLETVKRLDAKGIACSLFVEEDWTRYAEYLAEMPESTIMWFEFGDYKKIKEIVGKKHVIGGFYNPTMTLTRSKQECIDAAKDLVETCMPGGNYYFCFDKSVMDVKSVDVPKLQAVLEWVRDNAVY